MARTAGPKGGGEIVSITKGRRKRAAAPEPTPKQGFADPEQAPAAQGHNGPDDDVVLRYIARMDAQDVVVEQANAALKGAQKQLKNIRNEAKGVGIKLKNLDAEREKSKLPRFEQRSDLLEQDRYARILGNETWEAADLFSRTPDAVKDEVDAESAGYAAGLRCLPAKVPDEYRSGNLMQAWLRGHPRGIARVAAAMSKDKNADLKTAPAPESGDSFEAPEAELQGQVGRQVVQAQREGAEPDADAALFAGGGVTEDA